MGTKLSAVAGELHNIEVRDGRTFVRPGFASIATPTAGLEFAGGFTIEDGANTEVWHYMLSRNASTAQATLDVFDEEFLPLFSVGLGPMPNNPPLTASVVNRQLVINSPHLSTPYYGPVGAGLVPMLKTPTNNPDLTALDPPTGLSCAWKGRIATAQNDNLFINTGTIDPRTFIAQNIFKVDGAITDLFEGPDGALWFFTTNGAFAMAADALSQAQLATPFIAAIPGIQTMRPNNACTTCGTVLALTRDGLAVVTTSSQTRIDITPYEGPRGFTWPVEVQDLRAEARIYPTSNGAIVAFEGARPYCLNVDLRNGFRSYWRTANPLASELITGVLRSRDGDDYYVTKGRIFQPIGTTDYTGSSPQGIICVRENVDADDSLCMRGVTVATDAVGFDTHVFAAGQATTVSAPAIDRDAVIGTALWSATETYGARDIRTVDHPRNGARMHDVLVEYGATGAYRHIALGDIEYEGQAPKRRNRRG